MAGTTGQSGGSPINIDQILQALKAIAQADNSVASAIAAVFPTTGAVASTATAGAATLPATPQAFLTLTVGATAYKVALYLP